MAGLITKEGIREVRDHLALKEGTLKEQLFNAIISYFPDDDSLLNLTSIPADDLIKKVWETDDPEEIKSKRKNLSSLKSALNKSLKQLDRKGKNPEGIILGRDNVFTVSDERKDDLLKQMGLSGETPKTAREMIKAFQSIFSDILKEQGLDGVNELLRELEETKKAVRSLAGLPPEEEPKTAATPSSADRALAGTGAETPGEPPGAEARETKTAPGAGPGGAGAAEIIELAEGKELEGVAAEEEGLPGGESGEIEEIAEELPEAAEAEEPSLEELEMPPGAGPAEAGEEEIIELDEDEEFEEVTAGEEPLPGEVSGEIEEIDEELLETTEMEEPLLEELEVPPEAEPEMADGQEIIELAEDEEIEEVAAGEEPLPEEVSGEIEEIGEELPETAEVEESSLEELEMPPGAEPAEAGEEEIIELAEGEELEEVAAGEEPLPGEVSGEIEEIDEEFLETAEMEEPPLEELEMPPGAGPEMADDQEIIELAEDEEFEEVAAGEEALPEEVSGEIEKIDEELLETAEMEEPPLEELEMPPGVGPAEAGEEEIIELAEGEELEEVAAGEEPLPGEVSGEIEEIGEELLETAEVEEPPLEELEMPLGAEPAEAGEEEIIELAEDEEIEEVAAGEEPLPEEVSGEIEEIDEIDEGLLETAEAEEITEEKIDGLPETELVEPPEEEVIELGENEELVRGEPEGPRKQNPLDILSKYLDAAEALHQGADLLKESEEEYMAQILDRFMPKFIKIPEGTYIIGSSHPKTLEQPQKTIKLQGYYLGQFPVTNDLFDFFVRETGYVTEAEEAGYGIVFEGRCSKRIDPDSGRESLILNRGTSAKHTAGASWRHPTGPGSSLEGRHNHPVVQVSHDDALAFAAWAGKRLPTEEEWEAAARGREGKLFPWGDIWLSSMGNFESACLGDTTPVDHHGPHSVSPFGIYDLLGNVLEWTSTPYRQNSSNDPIYILKGGCWTAGGVVTASSRRIEKKKYWANIIGFRCAVTGIRRQGSSNGC